MSVHSEGDIRQAALGWVRSASLDGTRPLTREQLANDFLVDGERFPLVVLTGAEYADDSVIVDADAFSGVGLHGDGLVVAVT